MPTDIPSIVYGAVWTRIQSGITAYNADISGGTLTGCPLVMVNNELDDRTDGRPRAGQTGGTPDSYPRIRLQLTGGNEQKSSTPTFALAAGAACDAVVPMTVSLLLTIRFGGITNSGQTPLVSYINAAFKPGYPKLGIPFCRWCVVNDLWRDEGPDGAVRTVLKRTYSVDLRPHLSDLT